MQKKSNILLTILAILIIMAFCISKLAVNYEILFLGITLDDIYFGLLIMITICVLIILIKNLHDWNSSKKINNYLFLIFTFFTMIVCIIIIGSRIILNPQINFYEVSFDADSDICDKTIIVRERCIIRRVEGQFYEKINSWLLKKISGAIYAKSYESNITPMKSGIYKLKYSTFNNNLIFQYKHNEEANNWQTLEIELDP